MPVDGTMLDSWSVPVWFCVSLVSHQKSVVLIKIFSNLFDIPTDIDQHWAVNLSRVNVTAQHKKWSSNTSVCTLYEMISIKSLLIGVLLYARPLPVLCPPTAVIIFTVSHSYNYSLIDSTVWQTGGQTDFGTSGFCHFLECFPAAGTHRSALHPHRHFALFFIEIKPI